MRFLHHTWHISLWCTRKGCLVALWCAWLVLAAAAVVQIQVLRDHELSLPEPLRQLIERRLAQNGFNCAFSRGTLDYSGRILLEKISFGPSAVSSPLVTARSVYVKLAPWALLVRRLDVQEVGASGVDFHLPADLSPSGRDEVIAGDIDFAARPDGGQLRLDHFTGRVGDLMVSASGAIRLPSPAASSPSSPLVDKLVARYLASGRRVPDMIARLSALENPSVVLDFVPETSAPGLGATLHATLRADSLHLSHLPALGSQLTAHSSQLATGPLALDLEIPLAGYPVQVDASGRAASLAIPGQGSAQDLRFRFRGRLPAERQPLVPESLDLQLASARWRQYEVDASRATLLARPGGLLSADASVTFAGSPWKLDALLDPRQGSGRVRLSGAIDPALLAAIDRLSGRELDALLGPAAPAPVHAEAVFLPGWKLAQVTGGYHSGPVRVGRVRLDETGADFAYGDGYARCDDLVLRQGESLARGSYEMDTRTNDFRFLLDGRLRPAGIAGWFEDWWPRFWDNFDFSKSAPRASVDIAGRWGDLDATRVFVRADGLSTRLNGQPFDRVATRVFVRPQWQDILAFSVSQRGRYASGSFSRLFDLEKDAWVRMDFDIDSSLPLDTIRGVLGPDAGDALAPYRFAGAPRLRLSGHAESPLASGGEHETIDINLASAGAASFHDFPVTDLAFSARLRDSDLDLPSLSFGVAGGRATGSAHVSGATDADRQITFDAKLTGASLAEAIKLAPAVPAAKTAAKVDASGDKPAARRLTRGTLDLALKANGPYGDFRAFKGSGEAKITGADLGEINLFGLLSELLKKTIFDFSSLSLTNLDASFAVNGPVVTFDRVKITGPSASVTAAGDYGLLDGKLAFKAKVYPFGQNKSPLGSTVGLVLVPLTHALEVKLQGTLAQPDWTFLYGPTNFLRTLLN